MNFFVKNLRNEIALAIIEKLMAFYTSGTRLYLPKWPNAQRRYNCDQRKTP